MLQREAHVNREHLFGVYVVQQCGVVVEAEKVDDALVVSMREVHALDRLHVAVVLGTHEPTLLWQFLDLEVVIFTFGL